MTTGRPTHGCSDRSSITVSVTEVTSPVSGRGKSSIIRLIPGVLGDESSALTDSYQDGLLAPPIYTRPAEYNGWKVPEILTSGNTPEVEKWRENQALEKTKNTRPDLFNDPN